MTPRYLSIAEIFHSIQGEGLLTGVPSAFVRTSGCNLRCRWCDTPYTSWSPTGARWALDDVITEVTRKPGYRHVVITGGEPLIAPSVPALARALRERGLHITIETAGSVFQEVDADLMSISPKLSGSTPPPEAGPWHARHESRRVNIDALKRLMGSAPYQLKFVVGDPSELDEVDALVATLDAERERVMLMPEGVTVEAIDAASRWLVGAVEARGYRFCDRLHIRLFGNTPGT